ncbi:response regulator transcription factor [Sphingomonas sp. DT-207]|uniref:response regulator transcription factor n=1 Tax=Sphingomonas sp. DT-207 TaxID=3396167 RepID=UPI003F1CC4E7
MRIGILEDEPELATYLAQTLAKAGYSCFVFHSGQKMINLLTHETLDLLLLDWNIPDVSGLSVIRWVKENLTKAPPILMLTSRTTEEDVVMALQAGADDFVVKPVQPAVLTARIEAIRRRAYPEPPQGRVEQFGDYRFDSRTETLTVAGEPVQLTAKEFALALMLFRNMHRTMSRSYLFEALWGRNPDLQTRTLDSHISKVRSKLGLRSSRGFRLVPVYAYGYRLETIE